MNKPGPRFLRIFQIGVRPEFTPQERKRIVLSNQIICVTILTIAAILVPLLLLNGHEGAEIAIAMGAIGLFSVGFVLNSIGAFRTSRIWLLLLTNLLAAAATILIGQQNPVELFFLPLACVPMLFLSPAHYRSLYGLSFLSIILLLASIPLKKQFSPLLRLDPAAANAGAYLIYLLAPLTLLWILLLAHRGSVRVEKELDLEKKKSDRLLLNILPPAIADRLKAGERLIADRYDDATVLFADLVGFTPLSGTLSPEQLVNMLNEIFSCFDVLCEKHGLEKIKTIGDSYMAVAGVPDLNQNHVSAAANMALEMREMLQRVANGMDRKLDLRIGLHSGPVVAGVIGDKKFVYDLWGDTVNVASRMESHSLPGGIHLSDRVFAELGPGYQTELRGEMEIKGKGIMRTYLLLGGPGSQREI